MNETKVATRGLLLVDHGTRNGEANARLAQLAHEVARARPTWLVERAHMELAAPDFDTGIDELVARGATEILVHLHFLVTGFHVRESIPLLVAKARDRHPGLPIETTEPLGDDHRLVDIVIHRVDDRMRE